MVQFYKNEHRDTQTLGLLDFFLFMLHAIINDSEDEIHSQTDLPFPFQFSTESKRRYFKILIKNSISSIFVCDYFFLFFLYKRANISSEKQTLTITETNIHT